MRDHSLLFTRHSSLLTLARRVRVRWLLERVRVGLLWALAVNAPFALAGRSSGYRDWPIAAVLLAVLTLAAAVALGLRRWPNGWTVAVAADGLGLAERVSSAHYAARTDHPAARMLAADAAHALDRLNPSDYPLLPQARLRRWEAGAALALALALLLPLPILGDAGRGAADAQSIGTARKTLQSLEARLAATPEALAQAGAAEVRVLEQRLAEARTAEEAARLLEETRERLAGEIEAEDYGVRRALEGLAAVWQGNPDLGAISRAISAGDRRALEGLVANLTQMAEAMEPPERQALGRALQAGANAARDVPELAGALRQAAGEVGRTGSGARGHESADAALADVAARLSSGISRSAGMQALQQTIAGVGQARADLGAVAGAPVGSFIAQGGPGRGAPAASGSGAAGGSGAGARSGAGSGAGSSSGTGSAGSGAGSGGGTGGTGSAGSGAGAGGQASPGQPGTGAAGATLAGGAAAPSLRGTTNYDSIYVPSLMGGEGGPQLQSPGEARGATGELVELPDSPLALGSVRPYSDAYGQYEAAARQSLSRQPLPPSLQGVVQRYFSSIAPGRSVE